MAAPKRTAQAGKAAPGPTAADPAIPAKEILQTAQQLMSEPLAGRIPGTPSEAQARAYIGTQMSEMKLAPGTEKPEQALPADASEFQQPLSLVTVKSRLLPSGAPRFFSSAASVPVQLAVGLSEVVLFTGEAKPEVSLRNAEVVFAGYGLTAPEFQWDDYKDVDVQGKVVLILDGDPQADPRLFGGKARLHHGRWPYKFARAASKGAAAALVILDGNDSAAAGLGLPGLRSVYNGDSEYVLDRDPAAPETALKMRGFLTEEAARRVLEAARGDFDELRRTAEQRSFRPLRPPLRMSASLKNEIRKADSANLVGVLPGSDPQLRTEAVVYTAHFDGRSTLDSAAGVAALLSLARAAASRGPSQRSLVFAALTAQTEHFLGARHLLEHLPSPVTRVIAHINLDGIDPLAPQPTVIQIGRGRSTLDAFLDAAAREKRRQVIADLNPELGLYYRSESLAFANAGIPSLFLGWPDLGRYLREEYRQGKESIGANFSFGGGAKDADLLLLVGRRLAHARTTQAPSFKKADEFAPKQP